MLNRPQRRCPRCNDPLDVSRDMWGEFYVCEECGFAAEDDSLVAEADSATLTFLEQIHSQRALTALERR